jgi:hypothetical protein
MSAEVSQQYVRSTVAAIKDGRKIRKAYKCQRSVNTLAIGILCNSLDFNGKRISGVYNSVTLIGVKF